MGGWTTVAMFVAIPCFIVGGIWFIVIVIRKQSIWAGIACFLPFIGQIISLYYLITLWRNTRYSFFIILTGVAILLGGILPPTLQFKAEIKPVIIEFVEAVGAKDVDRAYRCVPSGADKEELGDFINSNYPLFKGYEDVSISSSSVKSGADVTTGQISGSLVYANRAKRPFEASLVKEGEVWKITDFRIGD